MGKLIYDDDGELRNCPANKAQIGYWRTVKNFGSHKDFAKVYFEYAKELGGALSQAIIMAPILVTITILFPVMPFIKGYFDWRRSKREVSEEAARKVDKLHD